MASENSENNAGNGETSGSQSEPNEHDYAHTAASNFTSTTETPSSSGAPAADGGVSLHESFAAPVEPEMVAPQQANLSIELSEQAVGAEVDCLGGNDVDASSPLPLPLPPPPHVEENSQKTFAPRVSVPSNLPRCSRRRVNRPEDRSCSCCKSEFERQGRSFNRRAVFTFSTPETVQWVFPDATVNEKSFLCETCAQVVRSKCKRKQSGKRSLWLKPPEAKQPEMKNKKKKGRRMGKKSKAALLVSKSCYKAAFKLLWSAKGARKPMMEFWSKLLKQEMKALTRQSDNPFHQKVSSRKPLSSFPWRHCLNWAQDKAPLVTACLSSLFPDINALSKSSHLVSEEQAQTLLERRAVVALSIPLFTRNIWKNNFLQASLGAELRLQGCSGSALDALNTMGLCQNKDTVRLLLHRLRNGKKTNGRQRIKVKHEQIREQMTDVEEEEEEEVEEEEEEEEEEDEEEDDEEEEEEEEEDEEEEEEDDEEEEEEMEMAVQEMEVEVEEDVLQGGVEVEDQEVEDQEVEDQEVEEKSEVEKKRRRKKAKKQRKEEKRKEKGKRKVRQREEGMVVKEEDDEGSEQKKRRVVVVRLGLLKGHSEVGRSDLSAP